MKDLDTQTVLDNETVDILKDAPKDAGEERITLRDILNMVLYVAGVLLITWLILTYVGQRTDVDGSSMENTLHDHDSLIVDKITYRFRDPKRFEIIVFPYKYKEDTYYIKRIIGLPGETVQIDYEGSIYINGEILAEGYGREIINNPGNAAEPIVLGEDEYFVMGDNRNNSQDSRFDDVGPIAREDIVGRAVMRIYPFNSIRLLSPKE